MNQLTKATFTYRVLVVGSNEQELYYFFYNITPISLNLGTLFVWTEKTRSMVVQGQGLS